MCCSVLQYPDEVAASILFNVHRARWGLRMAVWEGMLQCVAVCCRVVQGVAGCYRVLQCVAACCSVLQCVAVCCGMLQCIRIFWREFLSVNTDPASFNSALLNTEWPLFPLV